MVNHLSESHSKSVLVAMSGGVDSSVAACLLKEDGYDVTGASMDLSVCRLSVGRSCCSAEDRNDARRVCAALGIGHRVFDYRALFRDEVVRPFISEYLKGRTPSPCIRCNERLKFKALFDEADRLGIRRVATGHYARIAEDAGTRKLLRGKDREKDQSYFLFTLTQKELARLVFPIGEMTKGKVRAVAKSRGLPVHGKAESQEICFVPDADYVSFIEREAGAELSGPGRFVDLSGNVLGRHLGIHAYTVGQRRGLGVGFGRRQYVVRTDRMRNEVVLGSACDLMQDRMVVKDVSWVRHAYSGGGDVSVKIRSTHGGAKARLETREDGSVAVHFYELVRAIAPGQAAVFYDGDEVLGGGWIEG